MFKTDACFLSLNFDYSDLFSNSISQFGISQYQPLRVYLFPQDAQLFRRRMVSLAGA